MVCYDMVASLLAIVTFQFCSEFTVVGLCHCTVGCDTYECLNWTEDTGDTAHWDCTGRHGGSCYDQCTVCVYDVTIRTMERSATLRGVVTTHSCGTPHSHGVLWLVFLLQTYKHRALSLLPRTTLVVK